MATTTRATTPSHPDQFAALEGASRTPTSLSSGTLPTATSGAGEKPNFLRPSSAQKGNVGSAEISPKSKQVRLSPGRAAALTGAAAMAELKRRKQQQQQQQQKNAAAEAGDRQTSPNPAVAAMQSLMGQGGMSRAADAPAPDKLSEPLRKAAEKISVPDNNSQMGSDDQVSPVSLGSFGTLESTTGGNAMTATANDHNAAPGHHFVAEPSEMADGETYPQNNSNGNLAVPDQDGNKAISYSYPGPPPQSDQNQNQEGGPARGMSLPGYGQGSSPKSPASNKRHKCPYCATDFTRHHNIKSHLLTHSQEKPYVCQTCQARFRRLHDLKRHTKLHTGERPHTCDRCGRKFARGDALARHNKGPGGCAGRRSSFGEDEDGEGGEGMDGVEYEDGTDEHGRRISEPNRKRQQLETAEDPNRQVYRQHSSTYPPAPTRAMRGNMGPPQVVHPGSNTATSPRDMSGQRSPAGGSSMGGSSYYGSGQVFAEPGVMMTSSPKPLSPGQPDQHRLSVGDGTSMNRNRSTSLTTQFQQQHFGRNPGSVGGGSVGGSGGGRTPPPSNVQFAQNPQTVQPNILPPLGSSNQTGSRGPAPMTGVVAPNMHQHSQQQQPHHMPGQGSNPGSLSSHGRSSGSSLRDMNQDPNDIWGYVRQLESRFSRMQDEYELRISRLQEELISLRGQVGQMSTAASYSSDMGPRAY